MSNFTIMANPTLAIVHANIFESIPAFLLLYLRGGMDDTWSTQKRE
jgi:hypothetical protein